MVSERRCFNDEKCAASVKMKFPSQNSFSEVAICHFVLLFLSTNFPPFANSEAVKEHRNESKSRQSSKASTTPKGGKTAGENYNFYNLTMSSKTNYNAATGDEYSAEVLQGKANSTFDYFAEGNVTSEILQRLRNADFTSDNIALTNSTSSSRNSSSNFAVPIGYIIGMSGAGLAILAVLVIIAVCWKRQRAVLLPEHSIYTVQETAGWDNISLHYIDNPADFAKDNSWDDLSDDSYLASLDEVIAQRASVVAFSKRNSAQMNSNSGTPAKRGSAREPGLNGSITADTNGYKAYHQNGRANHDDHSSGAANGMLNGGSKTAAESSENESS